MEEFVINIKEVFRKLHLFNELNDTQLEKIAELCREEVYEAGATINTKWHDNRK